MKHIVVVGGGVVGLAVAYYARQQGYRVTVIDQDGPTRTTTSFGNAGMIVPSHFIPLAAPGMIEMGLRWMWNPESPFYLRPSLNPALLRWAYLFWRASSPSRASAASPLLLELSLASRQLYQQLSADLDQSFGLTAGGLLMLCKTSQGLHEETQVARAAHALGIDAQVLGAAETSQLEPQIQMEVAGSVYFPTDQYLDPGRLMQALQARLASLGVSFLWHSPVVGWRSRNQHLEALQLANQEIAADEFVICGGAWSPALVRPLGLQLPMQAGKGYSLTLSQPRQKPQLAAILTEARVAVTPMGSALRFGGTMEIGGVRPGISPSRIRGIVKAIPRYYPAFQPGDFVSVPAWSGLRPVSPDGLPYLGRTRRFDNLILATGHAMLGISLAPITGQLVAQLLAGQVLPASLQPLHPDRYA